jgi:hypothetical protein
VVVEATLRVNSSSFLVSPRRSGYYLALMDDSTLPVWTGLADASAHLIYDGENYSPIHAITLNDGNFHNYRMVLDSSGFDLFIDNVQVLDEPARTGTSASANFIGFGDLSNGAGSSTDLSFFRVTIVPEPSSLALVSLVGFGLISRSTRRRLWNQR